jgi:tRNA (guanine37-N1)-methyltransferase
MVATITRASWKDIPWMRRGMPLCVSVDRRVAGDLIRLLRARGFLRRDLKISRVETRVLIPIEESGVEYLKGLLSGVEHELVECNPPAVARRAFAYIPSYDVIGDVAIVRSRILESISGEEVVSTLKTIHPGLKSIYVVEETVGEYRTMVLRHLWGEKKEYAEAREYGLIFRVPLGRAYYNPRLAEEHHRIAEVTRDGEVVLDMFCGVGGFSIHIASLRDAFVVANDKNPEAYKHVVINIKLNSRRLKGVVYPLNHDALNLPNIIEEEVFDRIIANNPTRSLDFTPVYRHLLRRGGVLHLYVLSSDIATTYDIIQEKLRDFSIEGHRLVLEHSPRTGVFRVDLVKR